ncbi:MAG: hypothetical protein PHY92_08665 [Alphaproteobacteria bacterium]|nr:hypothetical protein [Alphaproteobacteria bacterium]
MKWIACGLLLLIVCILPGCGKKPGHVDAPPGASDTFPRTYPAPETDY